MGGYRAYREADLRRLEQIIALKFIGVPRIPLRVLTSQHRLCPIPGSAYSAGRLNLWSRDVAIGLGLSEASSG